MKKMIERDDILSLAPTTRYQGSKRKILPWLYDNFKSLDFETVLDGFGGTGSVSYLFKLMDKKVTFNDVLSSNYLTGVALIENDNITLEKDDINFLLHENGFNYPTFIRDTFKGIYYLGKENKWLDVVTYNIKKLSEKYKGETLKKKQALAYYVLFQACLRKRPFNLFHRKNLYIRTANVGRTFGNKTTWNTSFEKTFKIIYKEVTSRIFSNNLKHDAICEDLIKLRRKKFDLVYLDPPYARRDEKCPISYHSLYHFFEGILDYDNWLGEINWETKNLSLIRKKTCWDKASLTENFNKLFKKFQSSNIVVSYGDPGYPSVEEIKKLLKQYKSKVRVVKTQYNYRLNHKNGGLYEVLIIGT